MGTILSIKHGQNLLDTTSKSAADAFKIVSNNAIQKIAEATNDLVGNKIAEKITKANAKN